MRALKLAVVALALGSSFAIASPAQAAPAPSSGTVVTHSVNTGGHHGRRHHRFGRFASPFFFGGFPGFFGDGFGFDGGFSRFGGGCDIFLATGDLNSYILCRVG